MRLQDFLNSRAGIAVGLALSSGLPTRLGYHVANLLADMISRRKHNPMVRAVRANQWVVSDEQADKKTLDRMVRAAYRSGARSLFEFWHYFRKPDKLMELVVLQPDLDALMDRAGFHRTGMILVSPHMSNFDLIARSLVLRGFHMHVLSYPQPPGGYQWQNELRQIPGLTVTPISIESIRQASDTLREKEIVATGIDRPLVDADAKYRPRFFGRAAALPVFPIRLALKHDIPISVVTGVRSPDGCYRMEFAEPIFMERRPDLVEETVMNAEAVLKQVEKHIRIAPEQWAMFYPVWPEALDQMPI